MLLTAACSGGYPPPDAVSIDPTQLNQTQRLEAMNQLGKTALPQHRWRYELDDGLLAVQLRGPQGERHAFKLALCELRAHVRFDTQQEVYEVRADAATAAASTTAPLLLQTDTHFNAALMRGLVTGLQGDCAGVPVNTGRLLL